MDNYSHHVSGFFAHREEAEGARSRLAGLGLPLERIQLFDVDSGPVSYTHLTLPTSDLV